MRDWDWIGDLDLDLNGDDECWEWIDECVMNVFELLIDCELLCDCDDSFILNDVDVEDDCVDVSDDWLNCDCFSLWLGHYVVSFMEMMNVIEEVFE